MALGVERFGSRRRARSELHTIATLREQVARADVRRDALGRGAQDGLWDWDLETGQLHLSERWCDLLGIEPEESPGLQTWFSRVHPDDLPRLRRSLSVFMASSEDVFEGQHRLRHASGEWRWVRARALAVRDGAGRARRLAGSLGDVSERKRYEDELVHGAFHDPLTGLPNRSLFLNRVAHCMARCARPGGQGFAVLFLDLDRFKIVNDSLGHSVGDLLLRSVATRLSEGLRPGDTVARLGGDEFTVLLEEIGDVSQAEEIAARIVQEIEQPFTLDGQQIVISTSIGIAAGWSGYERPEDLIRDADTAMYEAKAEGRSRHRLFRAEMREQAVRRLRLESDLRRAIEVDEFEVWFQPTVDLSSGRVEGFEALVRWRQGETLVSPGEFVPLAEETGLIDAVDGIVLRRACAAVAAWRARLGRPLVLNVNVSGRRFGRADAADEIAAVLRDSGLPPDGLRVEITEGVVMEDPERSRELLHTLQDLGVRVAIDDFGTGYSSLAYLHQLDIDDLKVDRSFVVGMDGPRDTAPIVESVVALAHGLGLSVTAEGVETAAQLERIRALGCDVAQGYYFSRPLPEEQVWDLLVEDPHW